MRSPKVMALAAALASSIVSVSAVTAITTGTAAGAYATNGEPVWIPRNAANSADSTRADNRALVKIGNVLYLGGDFTELAPELGAPGVQQADLAAFNATTGVAIESFAPALDGKVYALVASADGKSLYVGGSFTHVNGQTLPGFAVLDAATGALASGITQQPTDGEVHALYLDGTKLYVGGQFQKLGNANRKMMGRLDVSTGVTSVDTWSPQFVGGMVDAIDINPGHTRVYAGGRFTTLNNVAIGKIVALDPSTAALDTTFDPPINTTKQPVEDIEATDTKVFVAFGGGYNRFVQFSTTGNQDYGSCGDGDVQEVHLVNGGTTLLVGGHFAGNPKKNCTLATIPTARIAEYDVTGPVPVPINPTPFPNVYANELGVWEFLGDTLSDIWIAGDFMKVSSRNTGGLAHFVDGSTYVDGQPPTVPTNVHVTAVTPGSLTVAWLPSTDNKGMAGYYIDVDGVRGATTTGTTAVVSGLNPNTTYNVQVQAFDVKINTSALSVGVPGTTSPDTTPPQAPTGLRVVSGSTSDLVLGWNAATDDGTITGYQVFADGSLLGTTAALTFTHGGLSAGSQHDYQVVAIDAGANQSPLSSTLTARAFSPVLAAGSTWRYWDGGALPDFSWRDPSYDDSQWPSGPSPLGYGKPDIATTIGFGGDPNSRYLTSYARTTFNVPTGSGITGLTLHLRADDGAAVFVNGKLAENDNLPAALEPDLGALTARDTAAEDVVREFRVPVTDGMLVAGTNVVAVEFHKYAPNSAYLAFDTDLSVGLPPGVNPPPPTAPTGLTATLVAGPAVQLAWSASVGAVSYEVLRNGNLLRSVGSTSLTDNSPPAGTVTYTVRAVDGIGQESTDSSPATVVNNPPDTTAPSTPGTAVAGTLTSNSVALSWTPSTDNVGVTAYRLYRNGKLVATTPDATPSYTDSGLTPSTAYKYRISAVDAAGNESAKSVALSVTTAAANLVLSTATTWNYTDTRVDMAGTGWNGPNYTVTGAPWKSGQPMFGFGDGQKTVLGKGGSTNKTAVFTWYFRTSFNVGDPTTSGPLGIDLIRDDGAIVYVNGTEVFRTNLPTGTVTYTTKATVNVSGAAEKTPLHFTVSANRLVAGSNTVAVELHNYGANNGDASFQLTAGFS